MFNNDFLVLFLNLNPFTAALLVLIVNFVSLIIPAIRLKSINKLFKNPAFVIGDFLILPLITFLIINFYKNFEGQYLFARFSLIVLAITALFTLYSGVRFKLMRIHWVPHGIFHALFGYMTLVFVLRALLDIAYTKSWGGVISLFMVLILVGFHIYLGVIYPKKL